MEFDNLEPLARDEDPETSHLAGEKLTQSGKRTKQKTLLLEWMQEKGVLGEGSDLTAHEISRDSGLPHPMCHKRLPDLAHGGHVHKLRQKVCSVTWELAWSWVLGPEPDQDEEDSDAPQPE